MVIFGYTGHKMLPKWRSFFRSRISIISPAMTKPDAALVLIPESTEWPDRRTGPHEILYLPPRDLRPEKWEGPKMGPDDPGIAEKTGFQAVEPLRKLAGDLAKLAKTYPTFYTLLPPEKEEGYPHFTKADEWLRACGAAGDTEGCYARYLTRCAR